MTDEQPPEDLSHAGAVVDKAIEYMIGQNIGALSIASALLGGAMQRLTRAKCRRARIHDSLRGTLSDQLLLKCSAPSTVMRTWDRWV